MSPHCNSSSAPTLPCLCKKIGERACKSLRTAHHLHGEARLPPSPKPNSSRYRWEKPPPETLVWMAILRMICQPILPKPQNIWDVSNTARVFEPRSKREKELWGTSKTLVHIFLCTRTHNTHSLLSTWKAVVIFIRFISPSFPTPKT